MRDARLKNRSLSFLHQAIRYRGKANYREALYLAHGKQVESQVARYITDLADTLHSFVALAGAYCFVRLGPQEAQFFLNDVESKRAFSLPLSSVFSIEE